MKKAHKNILYIITSIILLALLVYVICININNANSTDRENFGRRRRRRRSSNNNEIHINNLKHEINRENDFIHAKIEELKEQRIKVIDNDGNKGHNEITMHINNQITMAKERKNNYSRELLNKFGVSYS